MPGLMALIPFLSANTKLRTYLGIQILPPEIKPMSCSGWGGSASQHTTLGILNLFNVVFMCRWQTSPWSSVMVSPGWEKISALIRKSGITTLACCFCFAAISLSTLLQDLSNNVGFFAKTVIFFLQVACKTRLYLIFFWVFYISFPLESH